MLKFLPTSLGLLLGLTIASRSLGGGAGLDDDADAYVVQAIHLTDLSENSIAATSFNKSVSPEKHSQAYTILGNDGRIETVLGYLASSLNVDLNLAHIADGDLKAKRDQLKALIDAFANATPDDADAAFDAALAAAEELRASLPDYVATHNVSASVANFVASQL